PWFDGAVDREPNNDPDHASRIRPDGVVVGEVGITRGGVDWYRLPAVETATAITLAFAEPVRYVLYANRDFTRDLLVRDNSNKRYPATLQPGTNYFLKVHGKGPYAFDLFASPDTPIDPVETVQKPVRSPVAVSVQFDGVPHVQAFSPWEQVVKGRLLLSNTGSQAQSVDLEAVLSDDRWRLEGDLNDLAVAAGASLEQSFVLVAPPDALPDRTVRLNVRLIDDADREAYAIGEVATDPDVLPSSPRYAWFIPPQLRGGVNVAASANGGKLVESPGTDAKQLAGFDALIDGLTVYGRWTEVGLSIANRNVSEFPMP